jgi:hypothetical protein
MVHVPPHLLERYAAGSTGGSTDVWWAVEAHLETCPACADRLAEVVGRDNPATAALLDRVWAGLVTEVTAAQTVRSEAAVRRRPPRLRFRRLRWLKRWVAPALLPRLGMTALVVLAAVTLDLADAAAERLPSLVLLIAPVAPLLGVVAAWSRRLDPAHELVVASPRAGLDLVLRRTVAVLVIVIPLLSVAGWAVGTSPALWLLPCLACTAGALALGELVGLHRAATGIGLAWAALAVGPSLALGRPSVLLAAAGLPAWAGLTAAVVTFLLLRRRSYTALPSTR